MQRFFIPLLIVYSLSSFGATEPPRRISTADASQQGVGQNIDFVAKLVNESAAAKKILQSDNQEAQALHDKAADYLNAARAAQAKGNTQQVAEDLKHAKQAIFAAMQLVGKKVVGGKKQQNYNEKKQGLTSLLAAHRRIRKEYPDHRVAHAAAQTETHVEEKMREAQNYYDKGNLNQAGKVLNDAYLGLKLSLTKLRNGKTLVRSLHFEREEDEYRYELRRNDVHNMLINTVLKEKRADPRFGKLMDIPLKRAETLRGEAQRQAAAGDYAMAIKTMEESTAQVIRAIRMAGIFIPG